jgi:hypothetical protein
MSGTSEISSISGHKDQPSTKTNNLNGKSPNKIEKPNNIQEDSSPDTNMSKK